MAVCALAIWPVWLVSGANVVATSSNSNSQPLPRHAHTASCNHSVVGAGLVLFAANSGDISSVLSALSSGSSTQERDAKLYTPLHAAASHGDLDIVNILLDAGSELHTYSRYYKSPIDMAASYGHASVLRVLLAEDTFDTFHPMSKLIHAAMRTTSSTDIVRILLDDPRAPVNGRNHRGETPLQHAQRLHAYMGPCDESQRNLGSIIDVLWADSRIIPYPCEPLVHDWSTDRFTQNCNKRVYRRT